jgi:virginiamycin B lyase
MRWLCSVAMLLAFFAGPTDVQAGQAARERSIDELPVIAQVERTGYFMAWGFDALWTMTAETTVLVNGERQPTGPSLVRVDGKNNRAEDNVVQEATTRVRGLAIGEGAVWIPDARSEQIFKFDPVAKKVVLTIPVSFSGTEGSIGVGEGSVWITARGNVLTRLNATTGAEEATIKLPGEAPAAIVDNGFVWVTGFARDELYKVDATTNTLVQTIPLRPGPRFLAAGEGSIWVHSQGDNSLQRINPTSGEVIATIETGLSGTGGDITTGGGYVWLLLRGTPLVQIDPRTNAVVAVFKGIGWGEAIRFGGGSLWISGLSIRRLTPPD